MATKKEILNWVLEYACKYKYHNIISVISQKATDIEELGVPKIYLITSALHSIVSSGETKNYPQAIQYLQFLYHSCKDFIPFRTFSRLATGIKMMIMMNLLEKNNDGIITKLNEYFPRSGSEYPDVEKKELNKLSSVYSNFRKFYLPLAASESLRQAYFRDEFQEEYGPEFHLALINLTNTLLKKIEKNFPVTAIEKFLNCSEDQCYELHEHVSSAAFEIFLDIITGKSELSESDLTQMLTMLGTISECERVQPNVPNWLCTSSERLNHKEKMSKYFDSSVKENYYHRSSSSGKVQSNGSKSLFSSSSESDRKRRSISRNKNCDKSSSSLSDEVFDSHKHYRIHGDENDSTANHCRNVNRRILTRRSFNVLSNEDLSINNLEQSFSSKNRKATKESESIQNKGESGSFTNMQCSGDRQRPSSQEIIDSTNASGDGKLEDNGQILFKPVTRSSLTSKKRSSESDNTPVKKRPNVSPESKSRKETRLSLSKRNEDVKKSHGKKDDNNISQVLEQNESRTINRNNNKSRHKSQKDKEDQNKNKTINRIKVQSRIKVRHLRCNIHNSKRRFFERRVDFLKRKSKFAIVKRSQDFNKNNNQVVTTRSHSAIRKHYNQTSNHTDRGNTQKRISTLLCDIDKKSLVASYVGSLYLKETAASSTCQEGNQLEGMNNRSATLPTCQVSEEVNDSFNDTSQDIEVMTLHSSLPSKSYSDIDYINSTSEDNQEDEDDLVPTSDIEELDLDELYNIDLKRLSPKNKRLVLPELQQHAKHPDIRLCIVKLTRNQDLDMEVDGDENKSKPEYHIYS